MSKSQANGLAVQHILSTPKGLNKMTTTQTERTQEVGTIASCDSGGHGNQIPAIRKS